MKKSVAVGTVRIKASDLKAYQKTAKGWKKSSYDVSGVLKVVKAYKSHRQFRMLKDVKNPLFLKGQLSKEGQPQGARINVLPDGKVIDKAFNLFAPHLVLHDQSSHDHWDVLYQNKGGTWSYCYTKEKKLAHKNAKFKKVQEFGKLYPKLVRNVAKAIKEDGIALALHTLLKTHMRVGNEIYFKTHAHKGLTTLMKKDISIKGDTVTFTYLAKDGVPRIITKKFSKAYVAQLSSLLKSKKKNDFVFANAKGHPLPERSFKKAFVQYCGKEFYPHIIRSHYATSKVRDFLKGKRKVSKQEADALFLSVARGLGHKKYVKKEHVWKDNYTVTLNHYVQPQLVERVRRITK